MMTKKELSQYYYLKREISSTQRRLAKLRAEAYHPASPVLSDEPPGPHTGESRVERLALEITDLEAILATKQIQCIHELAKLERFIADIPDSMTRQIFTLRHVERLRWAAVAYRAGGDNTPDGVRMKHDRYLREYNAAQKKI